MKRIVKWKPIVMCFILIMFYCLPGNAGKLIASEVGHISIEEDGIEQTEDVLQPGDTFSLKVKVNAYKFSSEDTDQTIYISDATAEGAGIDSSKMSFSVDNPELDDSSGDGERNVTISGLKYLGTSKEVQVTVSIGSELGVIQDQVSANYTLKGKTTSDFADTLIVEKQDNIVVKTDATQNVDIKITNKGNFTVNQADVTLELNSKVEGLTIKKEETTIKSIKSKEVKTATFTIAVDEDTKAGVYPATVSVLGNSYSVNIQVDSNIVPSALELSLADKGIFTAGVEKEATILVTNVGDRDAKNIRIELVNTENVSVVENSNVKRLNSLQAKSSQTLTMKVRINSDFKGESVAIPIKINYLSSTGEAEEDTQYLYLYTNSTTVPAEVNISNVISPTGTFDVDQDFKIKFNLSAKSTTENIQVSIEGDEGIVPKSQNLFFINKLESGENKQYTVTLAATREAVSSSHPIKITVTYGKTDTPTTINQYGSVNIKNSKKDKEEEEKDKDKEEETKKGKPKVIIGEYTIEPNIVRAGEEFVVTLGFLNTNSKHSVHNLKANLLPVEQEKSEDTGNVFTPVDGSNTIYISDLMPGETETKVLHLYTIPSATAKTYQVTIKMAYEDEDGNEIEAEESLGIPVEQITKIEIGDINLSSGMLGDSIPASVAFYNRGRTKVNNMMVYLEGEGFEVEDNKTFIGTFDIGSSENYEPVIVPQEAGLLNGTLVVEYEDPSGETIVEKKEFEIEVEDMMMEEEFMMEEESMMEEPEEEKMNLPLMIGIGSAVVVLFIIIIVVIVKKRKAKKEEMMLDEED